jgi:uncharacterized protein (DUF58 family)
MKDAGNKTSMPSFRRRVPREGVWWLIVTLIFWTTGVFKGINLITLLGCFMLVIWMVNFLSLYRRMCHLRLRRWIPWPIFAKTPFPVQLEIANPQGKLLVGVRLVDQGPNHPAACFIPWMDKGKTIRFQKKQVLPRRGWQEWKSLQAVCGFPFGIAEGILSSQPEDRVLVFPQLGRLHRGHFRRFLRQSGSVLGRAPGHAARHPTAQGELYGVRGFRSGDSPKRIHWRTSARRGELMVREFEETPTDNLILVLDPWLPNLPTQGEDSPHPRRSAFPPLEEAIGLAATICWEWCRQSGDRLVLAVAGHAPVIMNRETGKEFGQLLMEHLAVLSGFPDPNLEELVNRLAGENLPPAPILVLSTRNSALPTLLAKRFHRPAAFMNAAAPDEYGFYERPRTHAP